MACVAGKQMDGRDKRTDGRTDAHDEWMDGWI